MRLDFPPKNTERIGAVSIHELQKIYEIDSGKLPGANGQQSIKGFGYDELSSIMRELAIVIPVKNEKLGLLEGALSGIPNECLVIIVSNSERTPFDRFSMEVEMIKQFSRFADKKIMVINQKDKGLGPIFSKLNYTSILDSKGRVRNGKAEGMIIGMLLAKMQLKKYVGFIDGDNYFPGAVNEYVKIFAAGFGMASTPYCNVRISWKSKPKIVNNQLQFPRWGRISEYSNKYLNDLISNITGSKSEIVTTGNAGEHALSMALAENLNYSTGYSVEPYELIDILEKFGGLLPSDLAGIIKKGVEIFQIETRNPHLHEEKGKDHLTGMLQDSLLAINNSKICNMELTRVIKDHLLMLQVKSKNKDTISKDNNKKHAIME
ncbi:MAG: mannosyl-3-phosphoglycerate synthase, partial [Nitrosopumilus sp.]|nr:mannosyl-3-phosphoglycerate synthase [Nitrosopumilus sp.]